MVFFLSVLQIQGNIHMDFCSTKEMVKQGCVSAALASFGSDIQLMIGVSPTLYTTLMAFTIGALQ